jgi:hypothetical protein
MQARAPKLLTPRGHRAVKSELTFFSEHPGTLIELQGRYFGPLLCSYILDDVLKAGWSGERVGWRLGVRANACAAESCIQQHLSLILPVAVLS